MSQEPPAYRHVPKPTGSEITYRILGDTLVVDHRFGVARLPLGGIERLRLSYEVGGLGRPIFRTSVRAQGGRKLTLSNVTWQGFGTPKRQDDDYRAFVLSLINALGNIGRCRFEGGKPRIAWLIFVAVTGILVLGLVAFTATAVQAGAWGATLIGLFAVAWAAFQLGPLITRNRPCIFSPARVPGKLLP